MKLEADFGNHSPQTCSWYQMGRAVLGTVPSNVAVCLTPGKQYTHALYIKKSKEDIHLKMEGFPPFSGFTTSSSLGDPLCFFLVYLSRHFLHKYKQCCSISQSYRTLCDPMNCSLSSFPVLHSLPEFAQTHVH